MTKQRRTFLTKLAERRLLDQWEDAADHADRLPLSELRRLQTRLRPLLLGLSRLDRTASTRLTGAANAIRKPRGTDWAYRPRLWREKAVRPGQSFIVSPGRLDGETSLFHDCDLAEINFRQFPTPKSDAFSPFDLQLDVLHFNGSFLSLSVDLPAEVIADLSAQHMIEVTALIQAERAADVYFRLNLQEDHEVKQVLQSSVVGSEDITVLFDLAYSDLRPKLIDKVWLDVIFQNPAMNQFILSDLTLTRRPRADF